MRIIQTKRHIFYKFKKDVPRAPFKVVSDILNGRPLWYNYLDNNSITDCENCGRMFWGRGPAGENIYLINDNFYCYKCKDNKHN